MSSELSNVEDSDPHTPYLGISDHEPLLPQNSSPVSSGSIPASASQWRSMTHGLAAAFGTVVNENEQHVVPHSHPQATLSGAHHLRRTFLAIHLDERLHLMFERASRGMTKHLEGEKKSGS